MSVAADQQRDARRVFATPGGSHDRLIRTLAVVLPGAIGVLFAFMLLAPLSPRSEISFLLDRKQVALINQRLAVSDARYRGEDNRGRAFALTAGSALQKSSSNPVVEMTKLTARIMLAGGPAALSAREADYDLSREVVSVHGPVGVVSADGYRLLTRDLDIDLKAQRLASRGQIEGSVPAGTFRADRLLADLNARTVTLDGNARLTMRPGKLQLR